MKLFNLAKFALAAAAVLPVHVHAQGGLGGIDEPTPSSSSSASRRELLLGDGAILEGINDLLEVQESPYRLALIDNYYYHRPEGGGEDGRVDQGGDSSSRPRPPFRRRFRRGGKFMMMGKRRGHFNGPSLRGRSLLSETETIVGPHWMPLDERRAAYSSAASSSGPSLTVSMDLTRRPSKMTVPHRFRSSIQSAIATWNNVSCPRGGEADGASTVSILDFKPLSKSTNLGSDGEEEIMTPGLLFTERLLSENSWNASDISISGDIMIAGFHSLQEGKNDLLASVSTYVHSDDPNVIAFVEVYLNDGVSWAAFEYPKLVHAAQQQNTVDLETVLLHNLGLALGLPATAPEDRKKQFRPSHRGEPVMNDEYLGARRHLHPYDRQAFCSAFQDWASDVDVSDGDSVVAVSGASE